MALPTAPRVNWSQMQLNLSGAWHQTRTTKKQGPDVASKPLVQWRSSMVRLHGCIQFYPSQDGVFESTFAKESWLLSPLQVDLGQVLGWGFVDRCSSSFRRKNRIMLEPIRNETDSRTTIDIWLVTSLVLCFAIRVFGSDFFHKMLMRFLD
jgi:hypothetical protein